MNEEMIASLLGNSGFRPGRRRLGGMASDLMSGMNNRLPQLPPELLAQLPPQVINTLIDGGGGGGDRDMGGRILPPLPPNLRLPPQPFRPPPPQRRPI